MGPPGQLWTRGDRRQAGMSGRRHLDPAAVTGGSALPPGRLRGAGAASRMAELSEQGPACSGTVQAQDTVHFPVGGRGPLLATLMAEVSGTTLGPVPHAFPRLCHVARFLHSSWSLREEGRQDSLHGRRRPLTLLVAHVPDEETRVTRVR